MARPTSKDELIVASARGYGKLAGFAASMTEGERRRRMGAGTRICAMSSSTSTSGTGSCWNG